MFSLILKENVIVFGIPLTQFINARGARIIIDGRSVPSRSECSLCAFIDLELNEELDNLKMSDSGPLADAGAEVGKH